MAIRAGQAVSCSACQRVPSYAQTRPIPRGGTFKAKQHSRIVRNRGRYGCFFSGMLPAAAALRVPDCKSPVVWTSRGVR